MRVQETDLVLCVLEQLITHFPHVNTVIKTQCLRKDCWTNDDFFFQPKMKMENDFKNISNLWKVLCSQYRFDRHQRHEVCRWAQSMSASFISFKQGGVYLLWVRLDSLRWKENPDEALPECSAQSSFWEAAAHSNITLSNFHLQLCVEFPELLNIYLPFDPYTFEKAGWKHSDCVHILW